MALLAVAVAGACGGPRRGRGIPPPIAGPDGSPAESVDFNLEHAIEPGKRIRLSDYRGQVVLVNYFATWCTPCIAEIPAFNQLAHGDDPVEGFEVVGVALDLDGRALVREFVDYMEIGYPVALADQNTLNGLTPFGTVRAIPASFLVDAQGRHVETFMGLTPIEYLRHRVAELVEDGR